MRIKAELLKIEMYKEALESASNFYYQIIGFILSEKLILSSNIYFISGIFELDFIKKIIEAGIKLNKKHLEEIKNILGENQLKESETMYFHSDYLII